MFRNLRTRYAVIMTGLVVAVALVLTLAHLTGFRGSVRTLSNAGTRTMSELLHSFTRERGEAISTFLSEVLVNPLYSMDMLAMHELLRDFIGVPGVEEVLVFDSNGVIVHDGVESIPSYGKPLNDPQSLQTVLAGGGPLVRSDGRMLYITRSIHIDDQVLGGLRLCLSLQQVEQQIEALGGELQQLARDGMAQTVRTVVAVTLGLVALVLLFALVIARRLAGPLSELAEKAVRVGRGDYRVRAGSDRIDEIGQLEQAFSRMVEDLEETTVSRRYMENVIGSMQDGLLVIDAENRINLANRAATNFFADYTGPMRGSAFPRLFPEDLQAGVAQTLEELHQSGMAQQLESECLSADGKRIPVSLSCSPLQPIGPSGGGMVCIIQDISERRRTEQQIRFLAQYDPLTGLPNRALFFDRLHQAMLRSDRGKWLLGLLFLDLDGFKYINDTLGHNVGDQVLHQAAKRLQNGLRHGDTVARLGGDEFVVIAENLAHTVDYIRIVRELLGALQQPFQVDNRELFLTASVGVTLYPVAAEDAATLLRQADTAMYQAKEQGKNRWCLYEKAMDLVNVRRLEMEGALRTGLARGDFELYYQPQIALPEGEIKSVEALLRWRSPEIGLAHPSVFLAVLEEMGLIVAVGHWVLETACQQAARWQHLGSHGIRVAVNLSVRQFEEPDLAQRVTEVLERTGLSPEALELEITESTLMRDPRQVTKTLRELKIRGVGVAIDDFGAGFSSFSYLQQLEVDTLKIDRSLIGQVPDKPEHCAIVRALIEMARSLGKRVVLEGVETQDQLEFARHHQVDLVQGYRCNRPLRLSELEELLIKTSAAVETNGDPQRGQ
ncbi:MAG: EAL domain-containing protein [Gammaproteobacteria bacterium]|nr:EAL domain-containing protein [Gammaproteobacteria bacterium]